MGLENSKPYFSGQKPFFEDNIFLDFRGCEHFYPDVMAVGDYSNGGGTRHVHCCKCDKTYEVPIPGYLISNYRIDPAAVDKIREDERQRLRNAKQP